MHDDKDCDYYKFVVTTKGKISITFSHDKIDSTNTYWRITIINNQDELGTYESNGTNSDITSDSIRVSAGTYFLRVKPESFSDDAYKFCVKYTGEDDNYESETNDEYKDANEISVNSMYTGNIQNNSDIDYYKFALSSKGKVSITFKHEKIDTDNSLWTVELISELSDTNFISFGSSGLSTLINSDSIRLSPGNYYIKIKSYSYSNSDYMFTVNYSDEGETYESEPNNDFTKANFINLDEQITGNIQKNDDEDFFCFTLDETRVLTISLNHQLLDDGNTCWEVRLFSDTGKDPIVFLAAQGKEENTSKATEGEVPAGKYYIKVNGYHYQNEDYILWVE